MDTSKLCLALQCTLSNSKEERDAATLFLQQIATDTSSPIADHIRQSAAVNLKNTLRKCEDPDQLTISAEDDEFLCQNIFLFMIKTTLKQVYVQLEGCIVHIALRKRPEGWPVIFEQISTTLTTSNDPKAIHAALTASYCLSKLYRLEFAEYRESVNFVVNKLYGLLFDVASKLIENPIKESPEFLKLIGKSFVSNILIDVSELLQKPEIFSKWMQLIQKMFEWPIDPTLETPTEDDEIIKERKKNEVLKMKKTASRIFYEVLRKYGDSRFAAEQQVEFAKFIERDYSSGIIKINLQVLQESQTKFVHPVILSSAFRAVREAIKNPKFKAEMRTGLSEILQIYTFPKLLFHPKDIKLWDEDPQEFVKLVLEEEIWDDYDPRFTAMQLIDIACSEKDYYKEGTDAYHPVLGEFLSFLTTIFDKSIKGNDARTFDAALFAIGNLEEEIEKYQVLVDNIEPVIKQYILPNLKNPIGIIRMRCAWVYLKFAAVDFKDEQSLSAAFHELINALKDKELPVKVMAALAISNLVTKESLAKDIKPHITEIIATYLALMREIDIDQLVNALNSIIKAFSQEIKPFAIELIKEILKAYNKISESAKEKEKGEEVEDGGDGELASSACLEAIGTIIEVIEKDQTALQQAEGLLVPVVLRCFTPNRLVDFDSAVDLLVRLSYYSRKTTPTFWELFTIFINMTVGTPEEVATKEEVKKDGSWAFENLKDILIIIQNIITRDPDTFLVGGCPQGTYIDIVFNFINRIIEISKNQEGDEEVNAILGIKLMITLLEALKV